MKKQCYEGYAEGQAQNQEDRENAEPESQSKGTTSRRVPQLEKEMDQMRKVMVEMRENMRRANPVKDLVYQSDSFTASINGHLLPPKLSCTFKESQTRLCVEPSLSPSKGQHECGSTKYPRTQ